MAGGAVRELITKVKFVVDNSSLSKINTEIRKLKKSLQGINSKDKNINFKTPGLDTALNGIQRVKAQLKDLNGEVAKVHVKSTIDPINKSTVMNTVKNQAQMAGNRVQPVKSQAQPNVKQSPKESSFTDNAGTIAATGMAMVAPLAFPIKTAMEFEAALSSVQAKLGLTKDEMAGVAKEAEKLGAETKFSSVEVLKAADYLAQAGWKEQEIRAGLKDMLQLAIAGDMDLARTADIVSDGLTALNMSADETAHFNDIMATAASNSNTNISIMGETFKQLLPVAGALGYSIDDVGLAIELMADKGLKGERAGSSLVAVLNGLAKPTKEAAAVIDDLGIKMFDEAGKALPLKSVIEQLRNSFNSLTAEQKQTYASTIAGVDGMKGLLDIVGATDERYKQFVGTIQNANGATDRMAKTMHDNAQGSVDDLMSALQGLSKTIGDVFLGSLKDVLKEVTSFIQKLGEFAKAHPKIVAGIAGAVAAMGSLLVVLGTVGIAISGISTAIGALAPVFSAVMGVLSAGFAPILAIIAGVAAVIYTIKENWDIVMAVFRPGLQAMESGLESLRQAWENIQPFITALMPLIKIVAQLIGGVIVANVLVMWNLFTAAFNAIAGLIEWVSGLLGGLGSMIQSIGNALGGIIDKAKEFIGMGGAISSVNSSVVQRMWDSGTGQGSVTQSQNNTYNLPSMEALPAAQSASNSWFGQTDWAYE